MKDDQGDGVKLNCTSCGADIPASNMNLDRALAKCDRCDSVFSFADKFQLPTPREQVLATLEPKPHVSKPKSISINNRGTELIIVRKWFGPTFYFLFPFSIIWNGFVSIFVIAAITSGQWPMLLFISIHLTVGLGLGYFTLALLLNSTELQVDRYRINIQSGPLPFHGKKSITSATIDQLYCKQKFTSTRNGSSISYQLTARTKSNQTQVLLRNLTNPDEALFLEQEIERFLGIQDRPVRGEYIP